MILGLHISAAIISLLVSGYSYFRPSARLMKASYSLVGLTLASGTYLVIAGPAHILSVCLSGLLYIGAVSTSLALARGRLARQLQ